MNRHERQKAGELPTTIEPGMQLVLGELGSVVSVVVVDDGLVRTSGAGRLESSVFDIAEDGSMTLEQALRCELACDWDPCWHRADFYACDDLAELEHTSPDAAIAGRFDRDRDLALACPVEVTAYVRSAVPVNSAHAPYCICVAVATKQYAAEEVRHILRSAVRFANRIAQDTTSNNLSL